jgi:hypothetical protein
MATRQRPAGPGVHVSEEDAVQARIVLERVLDDLDTAHRTARDALATIAHPTERAKAIMAVRRATVGPLAARTDDLFETSVVDAYTVGKKGHGWFGYGALAEQLDLSRARVQQIVKGTWRNKPTKSAAAKKPTTKSTIKPAAKAPTKSVAKSGAMRSSR